MEFCIGKCISDTQKICLEICFLNMFCTLILHPFSNLGVINWLKGYGRVHLKCEHDDDNQSPVANRPKKQKALLSWYPVFTASNYSTEVTEDAYLNTLRLLKWDGKRMAKRFTTGWLYSTWTWLWLNCLPGYLTIPDLLNCDLMSNLTLRELCWLWLTVYWVTWL